MNKINTYIECAPEKMLSKLSPRAKNPTVIRHIDIYRRNSRVSGMTGRESRARGLIDARARTREERQSTTDAGCYMRAAKIGYIYYIYE